MAALTQRNRSITIGTGVTCPTFRNNPAIVAQAFASLAVMAPGRVFLGAGTGEALNEVPTGGGWGRNVERAERLVEAIVIIRALWEQEWVSFHGKHYQIKQAMHAEALTAIAKQGFTHMFIHSAQEDQHLFIEAYGSHVIPAVRDALRDD